MRFKSLSLSILISAVSSTFSTYAQTQVEETNWITDASQFVSGAGSDYAALIDGKTETVWKSAGSSFTVRLSEGYLDGTPFVVKFTVPAGSENIPTGFVIYGSHDDNGTLKGENRFGFTTKQLNYDGSVEFTSPVFYIRGGFDNQWWYCTHMRFECTETPAGDLSNFELAEFQICEYREYEEVNGPVLKNNGDIINAAENNQGNDWYKPLIDGNASTYWDANSKGDWVWQGKSGTGLIVRIPVDKETNYELKIGRTDQKETGFPTRMQWSYEDSNGTWNNGGILEIGEIEKGTDTTITFTIRPDYKRLKFETIANVGDELIAEWAGKHPNTVLSCFQFYGPTREYTPVPNPLPDLGNPIPTRIR